MGSTPAAREAELRHHLSRRSGKRTALWGLLCAAKERAVRKAGRRGKESKLLPLPSAGSAIPMSYAPERPQIEECGGPGARSRSPQLAPPMAVVWKPENLYIGPVTHIRHSRASTLSLMGIRSKLGALQG